MAWPQTQAGLEAHSHSQAYAAIVESANYGCLIGIGPASCRLGGGSGTAVLLRIAAMVVWRQLEILESRVFESIMRRSWHSIARIYA